MVRVQENDGNRLVHDGVGSLLVHCSGSRSFVTDLAQAQGKWLGSAFLGGVIFNLANILLVAAIDIAGLAVAFPVGIGLALILGVRLFSIPRRRGR